MPADTAGIQSSPGIHPEFQTADYHSCLFSRAVVRQPKRIQNHGWPPFRSAASEMAPCGAGSKGCIIARIQWRKVGEAAP